MRRPFHLLALSALASLAAASTAAAGGYPPYGYSGCGAPCAPPVPVYSGCASPCAAPVYSGCASPCAQPAPMYVVNQGPVYYGPGIVTAPSGVYSGCASPCAPSYAPAAYPYVSHDYQYRPYDGAPYVAPYRPRVRYYTRWQRPAMIYRPYRGPRVVSVSHPPRMHYRSAPRRPAKQVDPGSK